MKLLGQTAHEKVGGASQIESDLWIFIAASHITMWNSMTLVRRQDAAAAVRCQPPLVCSTRG
jgi:hypothetical protein